MMDNDAKEEGICRRSRPIDDLFFSPEFTYTTVGTFLNFWKCALSWWLCLLLLVNECQICGGVTSRDIGSWFLRWVKSEMCHSKSHGGRHFLKVEKGVVVALYLGCWISNFVALENNSVVVLVQRNMWKEGTNSWWWKHTTVADSHMRMMQDEASRREHRNLRIVFTTNGLFCRGFSHDQVREPVRDRSCEEVLIMWKTLVFAHKPKKMVPKSRADRPRLFSMVGVH